MDKRPVLVYYSQDCFADTDTTILRHLTKDFDVICFYMYESTQSIIQRFNPHWMKEYCEKYGITLEIVDPMMRRRNPKNLLFYHKVAQKINSYNPDIVYGCSIYPFWAISYGWIKCSIRILGLHDVSMHSYKFSIARHLIQYNKERLIKKFTHIISFSNNQHDLLKSRFGKESYMVGMSIKNFGKSDIKPAPIKDGIKLLFFGTISLYKGLDILIKALEELREEDVTNISLTIAGKGESWDECKQFIKTPEIYNLQVRFIDNDEIPNLMSSHHFIVLPYRDATQSGPLVAAIGYELPVIAPKFGCFTEMLSEDNAILYKQGDLKNALLKVSNMSPMEYNTLKERISLVKENYSEENIARNYINAFNKIREAASIHA